MRRQLMMFLLDFGYVRGQSRIARHVGIRLLRGHLQANDSTTTEREQLRAVLLELHTARQERVAASAERVLP